jgi:hypothetical protein
MTEKYFTRQEAEELLPLIEQSLKEARAHKQKMEGLNHELAQAAARIMVLGGSVPHYGQLAATKAQRDQFGEELREAVETIQQTGCLVKDLDEGLVDFPSLRQGEEVYLCWKLGEERIGYWHGIEEGFAGRKPLDDASAGEPPSPPGRLH